MRAACPVVPYLNTELLSKATTSLRHMLPWNKYTWVHGYLELCASPWYWVQACKVCRGVRLGTDSTTDRSVRESEYGTFGLTLA